MKFADALQSHPVHIIAKLLLIIGGLNWLSIGTTGHDLVPAVVGYPAAKYVYDIVGVSAIYVLVCMIMWIADGMHK